MTRSASGDRSTLVVGAGAIPNVSSTSTEDVKAVAPIRNSAFVPAESADVISPGTVNTSRPSSSARSAVMRAPLRSRASTTTVAAASPAMIRFRASARQYSTQGRTMAKAIGYVRVSRVGGRSGDSFISPELQTQSIERVCQREGLTLVDVVEELDASGGDATRPLWNECLE